MNTPLAGADSMGVVDDGALTPLSTAGLQVTQADLPASPTQATVASVTMDEKEAAPVAEDRV